MITTASNHTQVTIEGVYKPVHLLLKGGIDQEVLVWFQHPQVVQAIALAYLNDVYGVMSPHVSTKWKGRGIALELSRRALLTLTDKTMTEVDTALACKLLEAGHYISDMFVGVSTRAFIVGGVLTLIP